jgi:phosphatidate cytidylyltransferase
VKKDASLKNSFNESFADLWPRIASAVILVLLALTTLYYGGVVFAFFWLLVGVAINWEWQRLIGGQQMIARMIVGGLCPAFAALLGYYDEAFLVAGTGVIGALVTGVIVTAYLAGGERRLWAGAGVLYSSALVFSVCILRASEQLGLLSIAYLFAVVWGADIFAYFGGRFFGGPKLWPAVSAGKTWSGAIIGLLFGGLLGLITAYIAGGKDLLGLPTLILGFVIAAVSQLGDLFESSVKRRFGVKDSSRLIPGHGGVMDRLDAFVFAAVFSAALGLAHPSASVAEGLFFW